MSQPITVYNVEIEKDHAERSAEITVLNDTLDNTQHQTTTNCILDSGSRMSLIGSDHPILDSMIKKTLKKKRKKSRKRNREKPKNN